MFILSATKSIDTAYTRNVTNDFFKYLAFLFYKKSN